MKRKLFLLVSTLAVFAVALSVGVSSVRAMEDESRPTTPSEKRTEPTTEVPKSSTAEAQKEQTSTAAREAAKSRLTDNRLRACQVRQDNIKSLMKGAADRGQRHIEQLTTIADRVEAFYTKRGKTLATYDQLVSEVNAKKAAAEAAVQAVKAAGEAFSCSGDNPKSAIQEFKTKVRTQEDAMKAFRTAVKNLIVGVKSVQGAESSEGENR